MELKDEILKIVSAEIKTNLTRQKEELRRCYESFVAGMEANAAIIEHNIKQVADLPLPFGLEFFVKHRGRVVVTDNLAVPEYGNPQLMIRGVSSGDGQISLPPGVYKFVLIAIPQTVKPNDGNYYRDSAGRSVYIQDKEKHE